MGAWGVKGMESDEGLDVVDILFNETKGSAFALSALVETLNAYDYFDGEECSNYGGDHGFMVLAELLLGYIENRKIEYETHDDKDGEITRVIDSFTYTADDLNFLITGLQQTQNPEHELYELWEESDSFEEWKDINKVDIRNR